jgi:hypothetical protein
MGVANQLEHSGSFLVPSPQSLAPVFLHFFTRRLSTVHCSLSTRDLAHIQQEIPPMQYAIQ